jgi:hypothetical protein
MALLFQNIEYLSCLILELVLNTIVVAFVLYMFFELDGEFGMLQVKLMCSYCKKHDETEVPDPYYGGPQGFEKV